MTDTNSPRPPAPRGSLVWGIKESFRAYVHSAEGTIDGTAARPDGLGEFKELAEGRGDPATLAYVGTLRFDAYGGMLSVHLDDPVIELGEHPGLRATAASRDVVFATLGPLPEPVDEGGLRVWRDVPAVLAPAAAGLLGGVYPPGTALDPVTFSSATSRG
ncbi:HtaA domain-containing protein [Microbacterium aurum]